MNTECDILLVECFLQGDLSVEHALKRHNVPSGIRVVRDAAEAWDYLICEGAYRERKMENPKLILLDLNPPVASGIQLLRSIRSNQHTGFIPVVVLTASNNQRDMLQCYGLGVNSYIIKPVLLEDFNDLAKEVRNYWLQVNRQPGFAQTPSLTTASSVERG